MTTNPSHILIARNSRGQNPAASLSSPTETHAAASGIFRATGSPPWLLEDCEPDEIDSELSTEEDDEAIDIDEIFTKNCKLPGSVKIVVESTTFWAHKEILFFSSPFFEAALSGNWSETGRPQSMQSVVTVSQLSRPSEAASSSTERKFTSMDPDADPEDLEVFVEFDQPKSDNEKHDPGTRSKEREDSLAKLEGSSANGGSPTQRTGSSSRKLSDAQAIVRRHPKNGPDAVIVLKEEKASTFHDFLKFVYPQMECTITWNNVGSLMNLAHKLCVPSLQNECLTFLLTHAAGKPIKAMRIAEIYQEEELYRESSRFVLDNPGGWTEHELNTLTQETLLKLEKKEKLNINAAQLVQIPLFVLDYWKRSGVRLIMPYFVSDRHNLLWYSVIFVCLKVAKAFVATLFDRMFSLGLRGNGMDAPPLGGRVAVAAAAAVNGPRRHFLYCTLKQDSNPKTRKSREQS
ncbi:hypothetical protein NLJ89_g2274 [Agrocybe chaxingu]|uniref:BTB domain-containing protein n=1 Tax=Agrocybe chaxingu TaxID=84603 RepID=A0A9W8MYX1_9AGAR|nr:hypothetical protein NLJ89_g2274 [Agrocybe chaxingu]